MNNFPTAPEGTTGLACCPYGTMIYAVAARWVEASDVVQSWDPVQKAWVNTHYQVADFCHAPRRALEQLLRDDDVFGDDSEYLRAFRSATAI